MKIQMDDYYVFCQVAKYGSMKRASEKMKLPLSTVSRRIASLEEGLGLQLFIRNKNKLSLSNEGNKYYEKLSPIVTELANAIDEVNDESGQLSGHVVISTTKIYYSHFIHPAIIHFLKTNPKVSIELRFSMSSNMLTNDVDIAVVNGELPESNLIARKLNTLDVVFLANIKFAKQYKQQIDKGDFNSIPYISTLYHPVLEVANVTTNEIAKINPPRKLVVMDIEMLIEATKAGIGYSAVPVYAIKNLNFDDEFVSIFDDYKLLSVPFSLLYRNRNLQSAAQRAILQVIIDSFNN